MKSPKYPIFVVCSESHYTVLFCVDAKQYPKSRPSSAGPTMTLSPGPAARFDLFFYDGLANQDEEIRLTVEIGHGPKAATTYSNVKTNQVSELEPPLESCIRTKWACAKVDWNGTEPLL